MKNLSFRRRLGFSLKGIQSAFRSEASFRFQSLAALAVFFVLFTLKPSPTWWAIISLSIGAVLTAEMLNTALERLMDRVHPSRHAEIGLAKDCAAGAVLVACLASVAVFTAFLWERFGTLLN